jgi:hypothetical protein
VEARAEAAQGGGNPGGGEKEHDHEREQNGLEEADRAQGRRHYFFSASAGEE